jgi:Putative Ig domain
MRRAFSLILLAAAVLGTTAGQADSLTTPLARVTVIGDSIATAIEQDPTARPILARGVDLDLQLAVCRRLVGDSCPYDGTKPPTLVALLPSLRLGSTVVVAVGYNDFEDTFAESVETALQALEKAGAEHILWLTLRAERQSYLHMNDIIRAAAERHPEVTIVDWNLNSRSHPDWFQQPEGLHLTDVGAIAMATLLHNSLDELGVVAAPPVPALAIVTKTLPTARVGRSYLARVTASGGAPPIHWIRVAGTIPRGLHLRANGRLTGTPRVAGRRLITLRATDVGGRSVARRFAIVVSRR